MREYYATHALRLSHTARRVSQSLCLPPHVSSVPVGCGVLAPRPVMSVQVQCSLLSLPGSSLPLVLSPPSALFNVSGSFGSFVTASSPLVGAQNIIFMISSFFMVMHNSVNTCTHGVAGVYRCTLIIRCPGNPTSVWRITQVSWFFLCFDILFTFFIILICSLKNLLCSSLQNHNHFISRQPLKILFARITNRLDGLSGPSWKPTGVTSNI